ncbi:MAG: response regulator, partial [Thiotrichaceae bacterium]|nr:response regulator [Thiotrichaceae bacterium]
MVKILIVDDIKANRLLLRKIISSICEYQVVEAVDGQEAIDCYKKEQPDLILMDINMPVMNGYQSASAIKALTKEIYIPIIFVTALTAEASL